MSARCEVSGCPALGYGLILGGGELELLLCREHRRAVLFDERIRDMLVNVEAGGIILKACVRGSSVQLSEREVKLTGLVGEIHQYRLDLFHRACALLGIVLFDVEDRT